MFPRKYKKQSKLKRFLLKIFNIYAIDKESLNLVNPNYKNQSKNFFKLNDKSFILSNGYLNLERKVKKLDIFFRYAPQNSLWNSSNRWKRIVPEINKKDLILTCLNSLNNSISKFLINNDITINLNLISDISDDKFDAELNNIVNNKINLKFIKSKKKGNRGTFLECCDQAENSEDLILFVEDDYLFEENCIDELIFTYSRLSTIFKKDIFLCPSDYPFYYDSQYNTSLYIGKNYKWRIVYETLLTFMFSKKIYDNFSKNIRLVGEHENNPFEKPMHEIYNGLPCFSPVNTLSYHISRSVPSTNENWLELWNQSFKKSNQL